jgi:phosphoserine phosphatase
MLTELFLIRHGETKWNKESIFRGRSDIPLNESGLSQAGAAGAYLQDIDFAAVYCSPLTRARQTADAICLGRAINPQPIEEFNDLSFGPLEGKSLKELTSLYPEAINTWRTEPHRHHLTGAETLDQARMRASAEIEKLALANPGKIIAIVSHRVILKLLLLRALNLGNEAFWKIKQDTCCINVLQYSAQDGFIVVKINETCHLKPLAESVRQQDF